jgi:hypothetical protein
LKHNAGIEGYLEPLDKISRKCEHSDKCSSIAFLIAKKLVFREEEIKLRYLEKFLILRDLTDCSFRFEHPLDGRSLKNLMKEPYPEHLQKRNLNAPLIIGKMTNAKNSLKAMKFNAKTRIRKLLPITIGEIEAKPDAQFEEVNSFDGNLPTKRRNSKTLTRYESETEQDTRDVEDPQLTGSRQCAANISLLMEVGNDTHPDYDY